MGNENLGGRDGRCHRNPITTGAAHRVRFGPLMITVFVAVLSLARLLYARAQKA